MGLVILLLIVIGIVAIVVASRDRYREEVDAKIALLEAQVENLKRKSPTDQD